MGERPYSGHTAPHKTVMAFEVLPRELLQYIVCHPSTADALKLSEANQFIHQSLADFILERHIRYTPRGNQPLCSTIRCRDVDLARRALNFDADLHEHHPVFGSLAIAAVRKKDGAVNMDLVELLLEFGADPAAANEYDTLLTAAASDGSVDIMRLLLDTADGPRIIHVLNCQGNSALHEAAHHNHLAAC